MASALVCGEERMAIRTVGNEGGGSTLEDLLVFASLDDVLALFESLFLVLEEWGEDTPNVFATLLLIWVIAFDVTSLEVGSELEISVLDKLVGKA